MGGILLVGGGLLLFLVIGAACGIRANNRLRELETTVSTLRRVIAALDQSVEDRSGQAPLEAVAGSPIGAAESEETLEPNVAAMPPVLGGDEGTAEEPTQQPVGLGRAAESGQPEGPADSISPIVPEDPTYVRPPPSSQPTPPPQPPQATMAESATTPIIRETPPQTEKPKTAPFARDTLEQNIASKWFVWLGGVALALSGVFLVKYSVEHGLLGPGTRITAGVFFAIALGIAGEWIRRKQPEVVARVKNQELIPAALSAAAVATGFGTIYAGYALYNLFSPTIAFALLVVIATIAVLLATLHGPFVAALGLVGAYVVPVLVSTGSNSALRLFLFLTVINAGGLTIVRLFAWRWLQNAVLIVAAGWVLLWMLKFPGGADSAILSVYLIVLLLLVFAPVLWSPDRKPINDGEVDGKSADAAYNRIFCTAAALVATVLFYFLVIFADHNTSSLVGFAALAVVLFGVAYRTQDFELLTVLGAVASLTIIATWRFPYGTVPTAPMFSALMFSGLFGVAGFAGLWRARRPGIWAAVSAGVPVLMLAILFWRVFDFQLNFKWAAIALMLAGIAAAAGKVVYKYRERPGFDEVLAAYAVAVIAAIALASAMALREAWMTVSFASMVCAIAWINMKLRVAALRYTAAFLGAAVMVRLTANLHIFDYSLDGDYGFNWILVGYGIPALAFYGAARLFRRDRDDWLVLSLESAALLFFTLLVSFEIRHILVGGRLDRGGYDFIEQSLHSIAWGVTAFGLLRQYGKSKRVVALWGYRVLGSLAMGNAILLQVLAFNPLWHGTDIGSWPILNQLLLAYLFPALLCILARWQARKQGDDKVELLTGGVAIALVFTYVGLEIRHIFHGGRLDTGGYEFIEQCLHALAWGAMALGLFWQYGKDRRLLYLKGYEIVGAIVIAHVVVLRVIVFNPLRSGIDVGGWPILDLLLLAYFLPALICVSVTWLAGRQGNRKVEYLAGGLAIGLLFVYVGLEIRHLFTGNYLNSKNYEFVEQCLHALAWGAMALGLFWQYGKGQRLLYLWGSRIVGGLTIAHVVVLRGISFNPAWSSVDVGSWPIFNSLLLAYLLPAILCVCAARWAQRQGDRLVEQIMGILTLVLLFVYLTLEARHAFRGNFLDAGRMGDAELYSYSICWLVYAGVLLFLAVVKKAPAMRYGSLAIVLLAIGKVFLIDMGTLTGLYRAGSFLALGVVLIGIGYFYQRFVFAPLARDEAAENP